MLPSSAVGLRRIAAVVAFFAAGSLAACGGGESAGPAPNPPPPPPPPPTAVTTTVTVQPDSALVAAGDTIRLSATALDAQGNPLTGRTVAWSTSDASVATVSATGLVTGVGSGAATISATIDGKVGVSAIRSVKPDSLPGAAGTLIAAALPRRTFHARPEDYRTDDPALPGLPRSINTVTVSVAPTATVGEVNQLLAELRAEIVGAIPAGAAGAPSRMVLRLPTTSAAALRAALGSIRQRSFVRAASPDVLLSELVIPREGTGMATGWDWELIPTGGNRGFERIRAPQMWNLNAALAATGNRTAVAIFDAGFRATRDLVFERNLTPTLADDHGNHVAGIVAATFDNGEGVNGITPFARLTVGGIRSFAEMVDGVTALLDAAPDVRVVNLSLGYNWSLISPPVDARTDPAALDQANHDGELMADWLAGFGASRPLPVIVASAGNDGSLFSDIEAEVESPFANAALAHGAAPIIVVEASDFFLNDPIRASFTGLGGHLSAPGVDVLSTVLDGRYSVESGTSMAAPHVTGLIAHLLAFDPTLPRPTMTTNPVRDHLVANGIATLAGGAPTIDAFASLIDLDRRSGGTAVLRALVDVDDGSDDGNLRVNPDLTLNAEEDIDGNGRPGDGRVDMADFRRWRDWLLEAEDFFITTLDGGTTHPKKDLNGDGRFTLGPEEAHYGRGDFNGDGLIDRARRASMRGAIGRSVTDLEVLQHLFDDPDHAASDLPGLIASWDLTVVGTDCLARGVSVEVTVSAASGTIATRTLTSGRRQAVVTLPLAAGAVVVRAEARDDLGVPAGSSRYDLSGQLGGDQRLEPLCADPVITTTSLSNGVVGTAYSQQLRAAGGSGTAAWSIASGRLPAGLSLAGATGVISGTPTTAETATFTARATLGSATIERSFTIVISPPTLAILGASRLPDGGLKLPYQHDLMAVGGTGTFAWSLVSGSLPAGLTLAAGGRIAGTPTAAGTATFTVRVSSGAQSVSRALTLVVPSTLFYDGKFTRNGSTVDARLMVYAVASTGKTCFAVMFATRTLPPGPCSFGSADHGAWEGSITGSTITGVTNPGGRPMSGTISATTVSFSGQDPFGNPASFTGNRR